jgi:GT2 family glycosyltransferase
MHRLISSGNIVVDNGSSDDSSGWLQANYPGVRLIQLDESNSLAYCINRGIAAATGDYFLILNPDLRLDPDAIAQMVKGTQDDPQCAAVAAKLRLMWAPAFLNGLGNYVAAFSWGTDNGLGHLDLGQFDRIERSPSACFAATLVPRLAWNAIGPVDEGFPMYYEDTEWSYRARLLGYVVRAAPKAIIYHAFGGRTPSDQNSRLEPAKLRRVVYGRLRFALKLIRSPLLGRFLRNYLLEDAANFIRAVGRGDLASMGAYTGWLTW